jgi:hypothetical protein
VLGIAAAWQLALQFFRTAYGIEMLSPRCDLGRPGIAIGRGSNYLNDFVGRLRHEF